VKIEEPGCRHSVTLATTLTLISSKGLTEMMSSLHNMIAFSVIRARLMNNYLSLLEVEFRPSVVQVLILSSLILREMLLKFKSLLSQITTKEIGNSLEPPSREVTLSVLTV